MKKKIAILGSTGSIGHQALEVIEAHPEIFVAEILTANNNAELLVAQAKKFNPNIVVIGNEEKYGFVSEALKDTDVKVFAGQDAVAQVAAMETVDMVLTAMVGFSGLIPTIRAIEAGRNIALANKETLVVAGEIIRNLALEKKVNILPVDSEHSAIFQCLTGEYGNIEKIYLTASGGPFRTFSEEDLTKVTRDQALKHPNWEMGEKITIDSATLMNKGFEAIEAKWLFDLTPEQIEVVIHPQSIIHSIVQFEDGSMKAQMGLPDMKLPIQYALGFPHRLKSDFPRFDFLKFPNLTFEQPDIKKFRNLALAFEAMKTGGNTPCILNAANEVVVNGFLNGMTGFSDMPEIIEKTISKVSFCEKPSLNDLIDTDREARIIANELMKRQK